MARILSGTTRPDTTPVPRDWAGLEASNSYDITFGGGIAGLSGPQQKLGSANRVAAG